MTADSSPARRAHAEASRATARYGYHTDSLIWLVALVGLYWFAASFFLAKHSLPLTSHCDDAANLLGSIGLSGSAIQRLQGLKIIGTAESPNRQGCWMNRRVDALVILVVDALRFDFCLYHLPLSVGSRLHPPSADASSSSLGPSDPNHTRLFRFVADPPTVTMQRLKALTTGGLPTFADISANFGGASVDDDNWLWQLTSSPFQMRGLGNVTHLAFVGDDTWLDLYPQSFTKAFPYPSFNTRDLDTVDNGCLHHLPDLMDQLRPRHELEVVVVHFLGVDHVGHTYGPNTEYMDAKLHQMDAALAYVLDSLDHDPDSCRAALIFGDHGMTPDGNHGGGTLEEVSAALFVHTSPKCGDMAPGIALEYESSFAFGDLHQRQSTPLYASIHQIDLVPTLSLLLGLPIPYANLGSLVPSLLPFANRDTMGSYVTTALALNAAQVWRYLTTYSRTAQTLPNLAVLETHLHTAVSVFQKAMDRVGAIEEGDPEDPTDGLEQAAALFKHFLMQALDLGQRVWTRFHIWGMVGGVAVLTVAFLLYAAVCASTTPSEPPLQWRPMGVETTLAVLCVVYQCGILTFSNSYIYEEQRSLMYCLSLLSLAVALRLHRQRIRHQSQQHQTLRLWHLALLIPIASRIHELVVSGHGLDPSIRMHATHSVSVFLGSLTALAVFRWSLHRRKLLTSFRHAVLDCLSLLFMGASWWEKRNLDPNRHGFVACRAALGLLAIGLVALCTQRIGRETTITMHPRNMAFERNQTCWIVTCKLLIAIMIVSGPSASSTLVLVSVQIVALTVIHQYIPAVVVAAILKFASRHVFFATNHGCAFNRLQYSAAFVATNEFYFVTGGISLFLNTFGWELAGLLIAWTLRRPRVWRLYLTLQLLEALTSCASVSLFRRHLMVWDLYAPHFLFTSVFTVLVGLAHMTLSLVERL